MFVNVYNTACLADFLLFVEVLYHKAVSGVVLAVTKIPETLGDCMLLH